jgi:uncharacterized protein (DUF362 family)
MAVSKVALIRAKGILRAGATIQPNKLARLYEKGIQVLTGQPNIKDGLSSIFKREDRVGIKINTIGGKILSTRPEVSLSLANQLTELPLPEKNIVIWDRTNRELKEAGYKLNLNNSSVKIFATDTDGAGYDTELVSHLNIGSLFSTIQLNFVTASVSLALLKDHGLAGVTAGMKNYFGAIHNPNKYHDTNCNPFVAELFDIPMIKNKHRLSILDALLVQYHRGPSYHEHWAEPYEALIFSFDPVAADFVGWQIIEKLRQGNGLPSLKEENREPLYLGTAEKMGLGKANLNDIKIIEEEV